MRTKLILLLAVFLIATIGITAQDKSEPEGGSPLPVAGWDVTYTFTSPTPTTIMRRLVFISFSDGTGTFRIIAPRTTTTQTIFPAVWRSVIPTFMSFSSEVEVPIGNCCRETGTLVFKGERFQTGVISGSALLVVNTPGTANPNPYYIRTGSFIATPLPIVAAY